MQLSTLGWTGLFDAAFEPFGARGLLPARVAVEHRDRYLVYAADGEHDAVLAGRLRLDAGAAASHPVVGDWVAVALPRETHRRSFTVRFRVSRDSRDAHRCAPGCAVLDAIGTGEIAAERLLRGRKLMAELEFLEQRADARARSENSRHDAAASRALRARLRDKYS